MLLSRNRKYHQQILPILLHLCRKKEEEQVGLPLQAYPIVLQFVQKRKRRGASRTIRNRYSLLFCSVCRKERKRPSRTPGTNTPYCSAVCAEKKEKDQVGLSGTDTPYCSAVCAEDDSVINEVNSTRWCAEGIYDKLAIKTHQPGPR